MNLSSRSAVLGIVVVAGIALAASLFYIVHMRQASPSVPEATNSFSTGSANQPSIAASQQADQPVVSTAATSTAWAAASTKPFALSASAIITGRSGYFPSEWLSFIYPTEDGAVWVTADEDSDAAGSYKYVYPYDPQYTSDKEGYPSSFYFNYYFADDDANGSGESIDTFMQNHYPGLDLSKVAPFHRGPFVGYLFSYQDTGMASPLNEYLVFKYSGTSVFFEMINTEMFDDEAFSAIINSISPLSGSN